LTLAAMAHNKGIPIVLNKCAYGDVIKNTVHVCLFAPRLVTSEQVYIHNEIM